MSIRKIVALSLFAVTGIMMSGCTTSIPLVVERPPTLNTTGIKRLAVMPFENQSRGGSDAAQHATNVAAQRIAAMNHFTLVSASEIERLERSGQSIESHVDAKFVGEIIRVTRSQDAKSGSYTDRNGNTVRYTDYYTMVEVEMSYSLVRARDGSLIGPVMKNIRRSTSNRNSGYPPADPLIRQAIEGMLAYVGRDLAPYTVTEKRTFADDKNKSVQPAMKAALEHVKSKNFKQALEAYVRIFEQHKSVAAAENASYLYEALGEIDAAIEIMQQAHSITGNPKAQARINQLNKLVQDKETIATDYAADTKTGPDKVAEFARDEIKRVLPEGAKVWFYNNASNNDAAVRVVEKLTADFINGGISVVDRENSDLIESEHQFQFSGAVNEDDIASIGNATGASTIIIIDMAGAGAARRLQVKVLDVERRAPIFQSDGGQNWHL